MLWKRWLETALLQYLPGNQLHHVCCHVTQVVRIFKVVVHVINIQTYATCIFLITIYNFSDLHNSMGKIIHEASVAAISTVEQ